MLVRRRARHPVVSEAICTRLLPVPKVPSEKRTILDGIRADGVVREAVGTQQPYRKRSVLDRIRVENAVPEAIGARPYPRRCRPRGDRCSSVPCRCRPRSNRCSIVSMPMYSIVSTSMSSVRCSVLDRIRTDVVRETISRPCPRRCRPRSDRYLTVSVPMSSEKRSIFDHFRVVLDLAAAARAA